MHWSALDPENGAYLDSLGWVYYQLGDTAQAVAVLTRAAELVDDDPVIFDHLAEAYLRQHNLEAARRHWDRALELDPNQAEVRAKLQRLPPHDVTVSSP